MISLVILCVRQYVIINCNCANAQLFSSLSKIQSSDLYDLILKPLKLFTLEDTAVVEVRDEFPYTVRVKCQTQLTTTCDLC